MLSVQKVSNIYKSASSGQNQSTSHRLDKYEMDSSANKDKKSPQYFKDVLQNEISKKVRNNT